MVGIAYIRYSTSYCYEEITCKIKPFFEGSYNLYILKLFFIFIFVNRRSEGAVNKRPRRIILPQANLRNHKIAV